ncbi:7-carboxy-7-deazaguanine synthase [Lachnospiraceae bacterium]|nr:7-carboxy-7-deazaguanine synthase [Lachnospiraceae bacterium]
MRVVEKFVSINGEGVKAGEPAVFIRFQGCNLACTYCDTKWANEKNCPYTDETPAEIAEYVASTGITNVTLTGGEPLLQKDIRELITVLINNGNEVEIETNGAVDIEPFTGDPRPSFTMDYKLPGSGCEKGMIFTNFSHLTSRDTVKFVAGSHEDLVRAKEVIDMYDLTHRCHVYISPIFGSIEPVEIVEFITGNRMNGVRLQLQIHKVIWDPEKRGV